MNFVFINVNREKKNNLLLVEWIKYVILFYYILSTLAFHIFVQKKQKKLLIKQFFLWKWKQSTHIIFNRWIKYLKLFYVFNIDFDNIHVFNIEKNRHILYTLFEQNTFRSMKYYINPWISHQKIPVYYKNKLIIFKFTIYTHNENIWSRNIRINKIY